MTSVQISYERVLWRPPSGLHLAAGLGVTHHTFDGDDFEAFTNYSWTPISAQVRLPWGTKVALGFGAGVHSFFEFETDDFEGLTVDIPRDVKEWTLSWGFVVDVAVF